MAADVQVPAFFWHVEPESLRSDGYRTSDSASYQLESKLAIHWNIQPKSMRIEACTKREFWN